jgi:hypothetical protein
MSLAFQIAKALMHEGKVTGLKWEEGMTKKCVPVDGNVSINILNL